MKLIEFIANIYEPKSNKDKWIDRIKHIGVLLLLLGLAWVVIKIQT